MTAPQPSSASMALRRRHESGSRFHRCANITLAASSAAGAGGTAGSLVGMAPLVDPSSMIAGEALVGAGGGQMAFGALDLVLGRRQAPG